MANRITRAISGLNDRLNDYARAEAVKSWPDQYYGFPRVPWTMDVGDALAARSESAWMNVAAVWAAVRVLSEDMASLPLFLYRKRADGGRDRDESHHLYSVLHDYANPHMTSMAWRETSMAHLLTWGNCYSEKVINSGRLELYPQRPDRIEVSWGANGERVYDYLHPVKGKVRFRAGTIFHVAGLSWDGLKGIAPVTLARQTISLAGNAESFGDSFYRNGARPALVMTVPAGYPDKAKANLREAWEAGHSVAKGRAGGTAMLEDGVTVAPLAMPLDDAQFLETRQFQVTEIARWFRIPPHMIADLSHSTNNNIEHQGLEYVTHSLRPWLVRWEQAIRQQLLPNDDTYAEFQMDALLRGDALSRAGSLNIQHRAGALLTDEWRALENRNPLPDGMGQAPLTSADMIHLPDGEPVVEPLTGEMAAKMARLEDESAYQRGQADALKSAGPRTVVNLPGTTVESPAVNVTNNVEPAAITVQVPDVHNDIHIAEGAIKAAFAMPVQEAAVVNYTPPMQLAPIVNVNTPAVVDMRIIEAPAINARVKRDAAGRIASIEET